jgi:hypothetical protein
MSAHETIDLTKVSVDLKVEFDTLDVILLITTGGVGFFGRKAYQHFAGPRRIEIDQKNFSDLISESASKGAKTLFVRANPKVNVYAPSGGKVTKLESDDGYVEYKISFEKKKAKKKVSAKNVSKPSTGLIFQIRAALKRHAPKTTGCDLDRYSESIACHYAVGCASRLAGSRRGTAPALKNLAGAHRNIISAAKAIERLGPDEIIALRNSRNAPTPADMLGSLSVLNEHIISAYRLLSGEPQRTRRKGRPPDVVVRETTEYLANIYEWLIGKIPTRSTDRVSGAPGGDFDAFLTDVFNVLGIEANTEYRTRLLTTEENRKLR